MSQLIDFEASRLPAENAIAMGEAGHFVTVMRSALVVALLCGLGLAMAISRSIVRQLAAEPAELGQVAQRVSAGSVLASLGAMQASLAHGVGQVRNLAQPSAQAAKEIKGLIGASVGKVESGTARDEIVSQVRRVSALISEISASTIEQTTGIGQVSGAVSHRDQSTQQNAALVEQSAAAASLEQQASKLAEVVKTFRLAPDA